MLALVIVACLSGQPDLPGNCRGFVHAESWASPTGCAVAAMRVAPDFERSHAGWRFREALCVPRPHLRRVLARLNGEDV